MILILLGQILGRSVTGLLVCGACAALIAPLAAVEVAVKAARWKL